MKLYKVHYGTLDSSDQKAKILLSLFTIRSWHIANDKNLKNENTFRSYRLTESYTLNKIIYKNKHEYNQYQKAKKQ